MDINEKGGCVRGMIPPLWERMTLRIDPGTLGLDDEITLEVFFRWSEREGGEEFLAGFERVSASGRDSDQLRNLIRTIVRR